MWISQSEYERLKDCEQLKKKLEEETKALAAQLTAQVTDCQIGPWCRHCQHFGQARSVLETQSYCGIKYVREVAGEVQYCRKHLDELCPEFEP